jgi:hypothetical protein
MATKTKTTTQKAAERATVPDTGTTCTVEGCDKPLYLRGLCEDHWADPKA